MPTIHLICGPVGVGKTTYAVKLAADLGAVRFSIDDWISELFFPDRPMPLTYDWAVERAKRCEARIMAVSRDLLALGTDVVWDMGFMESAQRRRILDDIDGWPYCVRLHALEAPVEIRRERVRRRNVERTDGYFIQVTDEIFDFMEGRSEPLADGETDNLVRIDNS